MKKILILAMAVLGMAMSVFAQNQSINFIEGKTFAEVKEIAKKENKMIFMDFYTTWCGPCKKMDKEVYTNDSVADFYNFHFINIKIDAEKGEGMELNKRYTIQAYPTFIFTSSNGEMVHRGYERKKVKEFIQLGLDALDPQKQILRLINSFYSNKKTVEFVIKLIDVLEASGADIQKEKIINDYLSGKPDKELFLDNNWLIIQHVNDFNSIGFQFVLRNYDKLRSIRSDSSVNKKITTVFVNEMSKILEDTTKAREGKLKIIKDKVKNANPANQEIFLAEVDFLFFFFDKKNPKFYEAACSGVLEKFYWNQSGILNLCAKRFYDYVADKSKLERALKWAEQAIILDNSIKNQDTRIKLLEKLAKD